ncbi:MAG: sugar phosphate isomerase/epimerase [Thermoguttaceae bacterium]|nr:sugar phosphate isomerase/epimerase [Thermoguttaceae bacterium]MDW8037667.1 sugar phosphate isomerase/epimerase family protein [Thermoguttaceae bacterium]
MLLGYNTNGFAHHDLLDAVRVLGEIGYQSVAITIDHHALAPDRPWTEQQLLKLRRLLESFQMQSVIETGARYLLDPWHKHQPTLMSADPHARQRRLQFYRHAFHMAQQLGSMCVSIWSGQLLDPVSEQEAMARLIDALAELVEEAKSCGIPIGLEPEPGMFIDTMARYEVLLGQLNTPELRLTLDIGHLICQGETPPEMYIRQWADRLVNVHLEDMRPGQHEHLLFGEGQLQLEPVLAALAEVGYAGGVHVELSAHSAQAPQVAKAVYDLLWPFWTKLGYSLRPHSEDAPTSKAKPNSDL